MKNILKNISVLIVVLYLTVPLIATLVYSLATSWSHTILPAGFTFKWYADLFTNDQFLLSLVRTLILVTVSLLLALLIMVPSIYAIKIYYPALDKYMKIVIIICYAMPGVILSVGLLKGYANLGIPMIVIVVGAYIISIFPYIYQGVSNNLRTVRANEMVEAAEMLGLSKMGAFIKVILPNIKYGLTVTALLCFSILFGEFVLINLILGSNFETVQVFLMQNLKKNGHISSAIVVCYFILLMVITFVILKISTNKKGMVSNEFHQNSKTDEKI
ncbi:ABC transporter permease subunit [Staphylococcus sp. IVB6181]|uniref:ABC transporter permease n=1 Tax=Staphylococcus sp. IVB6181 TaxID=2929481 RepID=UPI0021D09226|nr:ABC transporter permease subunit [Staphylococcus sp. IVB6181]UXV34131.1 ABC transporter permease subunit [Staphylococcus sp. IVB6181]